MPRTRKPCICGSTHRRGKSRRDCLLKGELERVLKLACRKRDRNTCQWCCKQNLDGHDCHLSHVYPRTRDGRLKFDLNNVKLLCYKCHTKWHENPIESAEWFRLRWPDRMQYLDEQRTANQKNPGTIPLWWYEERYLELVSYST